MATGRKRRDERLRRAGQRFEPFARVIERGAHLIETASGDELDRIIDDAALLTSTNCGWATYRVARIAEDFARGEQARRARVAKGGG